VGGVSDAVVVGDEHVVAEDAFALGGERGERRRGALVAGVGLELVERAVQPFEEVLEHQQLRLDVGAGPPRAGVEPGPADLEAAMLGAECRVSGCSDHAPGDAVTRGERDLTSGGGLLEGLFEPVVELLAIGNLSEIPVPYRRVA
jgi:hypothetical protein